MKIGVVVCAYDCADTIEACLAPWVEMAKRFEIELGIVSALFSGYPVKDNTETLDKIYSTVKSTRSFVISEPSPLPMPEHEVRNIPLQYFLDYKFDYVWLLDGDEIYTEKEIEKILLFIQHDFYIAWWRVRFKNYIFDGKCWIDGFEPPRIFRRVTSDGYVLKRFYWDNDAEYERDEQAVNYQLLPNGDMPKTVAHVKHLSWLNTKGEDKVKYQLEHFGHCSYKWNAEKQILEFDKEFYKKYNTPTPEIHYE